MRRARRVPGSGCPGSGCPGGGVTLTHLIILPGVKLPDCRNSGNRRAGHDPAGPGRQARIMLSPLRTRSAGPPAAAPPVVAPPATREVELAIEGMSCAACAVRIEKKLKKLDHVTAAVNYATATARVTAPPSLPVEALTTAIGNAGYTAWPTGSTAATAGADAAGADAAGADAAGADAAGADAAGADAAGAETEDGATAAARHAAYLRRRLIVALIFFVPLTDLSLTLSLVPSVRFPGWQWTLVACAAPVALWAAWPFHRAALKNARHGTSSMDTLVSLGIIAACGWSVYAMFFLDRGPAGA